MSWNVDWGVQLQFYGFIERSVTPQVSHDMWRGRGASTEWPRRDPVLGKAAVAAAARAPTMTSNPLASKLIPTVEVANATAACSFQQ